TRSKRDWSSDVCSSDLFIPWADTFLKHEVDAPANGPADRAAPRTDQNSMTAHAQLVEKAKQGRIDVYFEGDSIVRRWGALDYPEIGRASCRERVCNSGA